MTEVNCFLQSSLDPNTILKIQQFEYGNIFLVPLRKSPEGERVFTSFKTNYSSTVYDPFSFMSENLAKKSYKYYKNRSGLHGYYVVYAVEDNTVIPVGLVNLYKGNTSSEISMYFAVAAPFRGLGIGTKIVKAVIAGIRKYKGIPSHDFHKKLQHVQRIETTVSTSNKASNKVFEKCGFSKSIEQRLNAFAEALRWTYFLS